MTAENKKVEIINFVASSVSKILKYTLYIRRLSSAMLYLWQLRYTIVERNHLKLIVVIFGNCVLQVDILLATM